jgi:hypothetical protein
MLILSYQTGEVFKFLLAVLMAEARASGASVFNGHSLDGIALKKVLIAGLRVRLT